MSTVRRPRGGGSRGDGSRGGGPYGDGPSAVGPGELGIRAGAGLPLGIPIGLDPDTRQLTGNVLFGGSPARVLRLNAAGVRALAELRTGCVASPAGSTLARRLTDAGLAHPHPGPAPGPLDLTVVIPVRDRAAELDRCLAAAGTGYPVLVVDDGSADPSAVAAVCAARGARLVRRNVNGGPGAARNTALRLIGAEFIAFLDSDCTPPPDWITALAGHFADPLVAAVAPRIVGAGPGPGTGRGRASPPWPPRRTPPPGPSRAPPRHDPAGRGPPSRPRQPGR